MRTGSEQVEESIDEQFHPPQPSYIETEKFISAFYRDHNEEQYQILRAFQANNFTSLRSKIPNQLRHGAILQDRIQRAQGQIDSETADRGKQYNQKQEERREKAAKKKLQQIGQLGFFEVFPYQQSLYDLEHQEKMRNQMEGKRKQQEISPLDFRPAGKEKRFKYEQPFGHIDRIAELSHPKSQYIFPFHLPEDTYDRFHQSELRTRIISENSKLAGDFIPSKQQKTLSKISRTKAVDIIRELEVFLKHHLPSVGFFIGISKKDHIDILFQSSLQQDPRLDMLLSRICESQELSKYLLRRSTSKWGKIGKSGYLQYALFPPWVRDS